VAEERKEKGATAVRISAASQPLASIGKAALGAHLVPCELCHLNSAVPRAAQQRKGTEMVHQKKLLSAVRCAA